MKRPEKEAFVQKAWDYFKTEDDTVAMPVLAHLTDAGLNAMFMHFRYCYQEERTDNT